MWLLLDWSSRSVPDLSWDPAIVNTGDVTATDGRFSLYTVIIETMFQSVLKLPSCYSFSCLNISNTFLCLVQFKFYCILHTGT